MVTNHGRKSFGSRQKNSKSCSDGWHRWCFLSAFRHLGAHFAESFHMSKSSWMVDSTHSCEMLSCSAIDLAEIWPFNWATEFLTVAYDGACSPNVSVGMAWISFSPLPCRKKNLIARVSMLLKLHTSPDMLPFSLCNKKRLVIRHMNRPLSNDTIDSSLRHREMGRAKDFSAPPCVVAMRFRYFCH